MIIISTRFVPSWRRPDYVLDRTGGAESSQGTLYQRDASTFIKIGKQMSPDISILYLVKAEVQDPFGVTSNVCLLSTKSGRQRR